MSPKPTVLVLGGVGFIGRKFVAYLTENDLASEIRVIDKVLPQTAYLNERCRAAFERVEFMQGNLSSQGKEERGIATRKSHTLASF
jgi:nucleoside-diphosphate-sugar epimerase